MKKYTEKEMKEMKDDISISLLGRNGSLSKLIKILKYMPEEQISKTIKTCNDLRDIMRDW